MRKTPPEPKEISPKKGPKRPVFGEISMSPGGVFHIKMQKHYKNTRGFI
jgi:hypothetical protein